MVQEDLYFNKLEADLIELNLTSVLFFLLAK